MSKVTMQRLAEEAGVSRINGLEGAQRPPRRVRRAAAACPPEGGGIRLRCSRRSALPPWANLFRGGGPSGIVHILDEHHSSYCQGAGQAGRQHAVYLHAHRYHEGYALPAPLTQAGVDGFLVLNVYDRRLPGNACRHLFAQGVPGYGAHAASQGSAWGIWLFWRGQNRIHEITSRLLSTGRTRLGFIGDVNYAQTNLDRYRGFLDAHTEAGIAPDPAWSLTEPLRLRDHYEQISEFLARLPRLPDAFVCASDFIASFVPPLFGGNRPAAAGSLCAHRL